MNARLLIIASSLALGACASSGVRIRSLPDQTPAADAARAVQNLKDIAAAQKEAAQSAHDRENLYTSDAVTPADAPSMTTYDPWERVNRFTYRFNARWDENIFLPVSNGYRRLPSPVRSGVHNFFGNLSEVDSMINFALQGRIGFGVRSLSRFVINSTVGIGGLFDVASKVSLTSAPTGFGSTLSKWGMHPGPYLVIPFLGPSTLRDGFGLLADFGTSYLVDMGGLYRSSNKAWMLGVTNAVDERANIDFRYYSTGSAFEYETIRFLYVRRRLIEDEGLHVDDPKQQRQPGAPAGQ
ncbi:MAG: VacJ family lipoprotein [Dokdonella sp.]